MTGTGLTKKSYLRREALRFSREAQPAPYVMGYFQGAMRECWWVAWRRGFLTAALLGAVLQTLLAVYLHVFG
jgi:hypothetical protein